MDHDFELDLDALSSAEEAAPLDDLFRALANPYARYTLYVLADRRSISLEQLTDAVTGFEAMTTESVATSSDHQRVRVHLHHAVLPHLETLDLLEYDVVSETITSTSSPTLSTVFGTTE